MVMILYICYVVPSLTNIQIFCYEFMALTEMWKGKAPASCSSRFFVFQSSYHSLQLTTEEKTSSLNPCVQDHHVSLLYSWVDFGVWFAQFCKRGLDQSLFTVWTSIPIPLLGINPSILKYWVTNSSLFPLLLSISRLCVCTLGSHRRQRLSPLQLPIYVSQP